MKLIESIRDAFNNEYQFEISKLAKMTCDLLVQKVLNEVKSKMICPVPN